MRPCHSRRLVLDGQAYLAAFDDASPDANRQAGLSYCLQRGFAAVGTMRRGALHTALARSGAVVQTFAPATRAVCAHAFCPFLAVIECVPEGASACPADDRGNVG